MSEVVHWLGLTRMQSENARGCHRRVAGTNWGCGHARVVRELRKCVGM